MLSVGVTAPQPPGAKNHCEKPGVPCRMNLTEMRTNFGAWCITSAPLILAMDLRDSAMLDSVWPIVSNKEAILINQEFSGDAGRLHNSSTDMVTLPNCGAGIPCEHPSWMVWTKGLPVPTPADQGSRAAVLLMNNANHRATVTTELLGIVGLGPCAAAGGGTGGCRLRDVWRGTALADGTIVSADLDPHDSLLVIASSESPAPLPSPPPSPSPTPSPPTPTPTPAPPPFPPGVIQHGVLFDSAKKGNELINSHWVNATSTTAACVALCESTAKCVGMSYRVSLEHCWLHAGCAHPEHNGDFNSALV